MKRFVLGVDLDGVCGDYIAAFHQFCRTSGFDVPEEQDTEAWDLVTAGWFPDRDSYAEAHRQAVQNGLFASMPEVPGASETLWALSDLEIHIRVVTHRLIGHGDHGTVVSDTVRWLQAPKQHGRHRIPFRDLAFLGTKESINSDLHLDDAPHVIEAMREAGHEVIIFDRPYNRHLGGLRAKNWDEVYAIVAERVANL